MIRRLLNRWSKPKIRAPQSPQSPQVPLEALPALVLYQYPQCPYCRRVLTVMDELELDIPIRNTRTHSEHRADLIRRTGRSQVPCLFIEGKALFESLDIIDYLRQNKDSIPKRSVTS